MTSEQIAVIKSKAARLAVNAYAGTGKTTTLVEYARARPNAKILYLAYNRAIADEAKKKFPRNVVCRTAHSLAYADVGTQFRHRLGNLRAAQVRDEMKVTASFAKLMLNELSRFFSSDLDSPQDLQNRNPEVSPDEYASLIQSVDQLWRRLQHPKCAMPMPHDGYLKLYQIKAVSLANEFDIILVDEAQDLNPVTMRIIEAQPASIGRVYVGDKHQGIYSFRGAVNAMETVARDETLTLTQSFRFGKPIAEVATSIVSSVKGKIAPLLGDPSIKSAIGPIVPSLPYAVLARTNAGLFDAAIEMMARQPDVTFGFPGGIDNMPFDRLEDIHRLHVGFNFEIKDPVLKKMKSVDEALDYAQTAEDMELQSSIKTFKKYGNSIPQLLRQLREKAVYEGEAYVTFSTAHKSKGLEWRQVVLADDFPHFVQHKDIPAGESRTTRLRSYAMAAEEINLLYVACTRAVSRLQVPDQVQNLIKFGSKAAQSEQGYSWLWD